jgi:hypothetical protein
MFILDAARLLNSTPDVHELTAIILEIIRNETSGRAGATTGLGLGLTITRRYTGIFISCAF